MKYAILLYPGHNRVYYETSKKLSISELSLLGNLVKVRDILQEDIAGVGYLTFKTAEALTSPQVKSLYRLSFAYAVFQVDTDGRFVPVEKTEQGYFGDGLSSILKYTGKTNELFTRMMINAAVLSSAFSGERIKLLDPIAGKGTTLFEALIAGYDATGIEIAPTVTIEAVQYFKKYLETEKYKHTYESERLSGANRSFTSVVHRFDFAKDKEAYKENKQHLTFVAGDSTFADQYFKKESFHVIVGDLPYGVQHGSVTNEKQSTKTRNPSELLAAALPAWRKVLKSGGILVLAWNVFLLPAEKMNGILENAGFNVLDKGDFQHRVDQAIKRDIVIARKN